MLELMTAEEKPQELASEALVLLLGSVCRCLPLHDTAWPARLHVHLPPLLLHYHSRIVLPVLGLIHQLTRPLSRHLRHLFSSGAAPCPSPA